MNITETIDLLAIVAAYDRRTVGEADAIAWSAALEDLPFEACRRAVLAHYSRETDWLMPAHLRRLVTAAQNTSALTAGIDAPRPGDGRGPKPPWFDAAAAAFAKGDRALGESLLPEHVRDRRYVAQDGAA